LKRSDLEQVSELFLTGTTSEILPVVHVDGQPISGGRPGPVTRQLQQAYQRAVEDLVTEQC
jgi:D-alanine transaminase